MILIIILLFLMFGGFLFFLIGPSLAKTEKKRLADEAELRRLQLEKLRKEDK